jgi:hypothetical protein
MVFVVPYRDRHTTQQKVIGHATRTSRFASFVRFFTGQKAVPRDRLAFLDKA